MFDIIDKKNYLTIIVFPRTIKFIHIFIWEDKQIP